MKNVLDVHTVNDSKHKIRNRGQKDEWKTHFKATLVAGKNDQFNDIRTSLNKLSIKNYDSTSEFIIEKIKEFLHQFSVENTISSEPRILDQSTLVTNIIDIMCTSKIAIYPKFYALLVKTFPEVFTSSIAEIQDNYMDSMDNIQFVDQNGDYDIFCANNKANDRRKAIAGFISQLVTNGLIPLDKISFMTNALVDRVQTLMKEENNTYKVEEWTENIFILMSTLIHKIPKDLYDKVLYLSQRKVREFPSMSSRAIFKYVEIIENNDEE